MLPGVTVEASSPALIEKVRSVVTDEQGQFKIVEPAPGHLHRELHLAGLQHVQARRRRVDGELHGDRQCRSEVGSLEETVIVSGQSPVVDVQNASTRNQISREVLDTVPTNKTLEAYAALTPGVTMGVDRSGRWRQQRRNLRAAAAFTARATATTRR